MANRQNTVQTDQLNIEFLTDPMYCDFVKHLFKSPLYLGNFIIGLHNLRQNNGAGGEMLIRKNYAEGREGHSPEIDVYGMLTKGLITEEDYSRLKDYFHPDEKQKVELYHQNPQNNFWLPDEEIQSIVESYAWDFFKSLSRNLMAGRKFINGETTPNYIKRIWRDIKDLLITFIKFLHPTDLTSGDYIKRFMSKINSYKENLVMVWEIMFEQCPYFPIPDIPNPENIIQIYENWKSQVSNEIVNADFVNISQLWLRQIGKWEPYELGFFKWYQDYAQWHLDTEEIREHLRTKYTHLVYDGEESDDPNIQILKQNLQKDTEEYSQAYDARRKEFYNTHNQKINEIKEHLLKLKFVLSIYYAFKIGKLPTHMHRFANQQLYFEIVKYGTTEWIQTEYFNFRIPTMQRRGMTEEQVVTMNDGLEEFHLQREFCFKKWSAILQEKVDFEKETFKELVHKYQDALNKKEWLPPDKRAKVQHDFEKFQQTALKVLNSWNPHVWEEVMIMCVSEMCSNRPKLTVDYVTQRYAEILPPEAYPFLQQLKLDDKDSEGTFEEIIQNFRQNYNIFPDAQDNYWWLQQFLEFIPDYLWKLITPIAPLNKLSEVFNTDEILREIAEKSDELLMLDNNEELVKKSTHQDQVIQDLRKQIDELIQFKAAAENSQTQIINLNSEIQKLTNQIIQANNEKELAYKEKEEALNAKLQLYEQNQHFQTQINELNDELDKSHNRNAAINDKLDIKEKELHQVLQQKESLQADYNEMNEYLGQELEIQSGQIAGYKELTNKKDSEIMELTRQLQELKIVIEQKDNDINELQRLQHEQQNKIQEANKSTFLIQQQSQNIDRLAKMKDELELEIVQLKKTIDQKEQEIMKLNCEKMGPVREIQKLRDQVNQLQNQQLPTIFPFSVNVNGESITINRPEDVAKYIENLQFQMEGFREEYMKQLNKSNPQNQIFITDPLERNTFPLQLEQIQDYLEDLRRRMTHPFQFRVHDALQKNYITLTNKEDCKKYIEKLNDEISRLQRLIQIQNTKKEKEEREENQRKSDTLNEAIQEYARKKEEYKKKFLEQEHQIKKLIQKWGEKIVLNDPFESKSRAFESAIEVQDYFKWVVNVFNEKIKEPKIRITDPRNNRIVETQNIQLTINQLYQSSHLANQQVYTLLSKGYS